MDQKETPFGAERKSLVCGESLGQNKSVKLYQLAGLIHLFVVSGSHFLFMQMFYRFLRIPKIIILFLHLFFLMIVGPQPPAIRFIVLWLLDFTRFSFFRRLRQDQKVLWSGGLTIGLFPQFAMTYSLPLSWLASLALTVPVNQKRMTTLITRQIIIFFFLLPVIFHLQTPSLWSIPLNLSLGFVLSLLLFPFALISMVSDHALVVFDFLMEKIIFGLGWIFHSQNTFSVTDTADPIYFWTWILGLHFFVHLFTMLYERLKNA